jgi:hypothetical protein
MVTGGETAAVAPAAGGDAGRDSVTAVGVDARTAGSAPATDGAAGLAGVDARAGDSTPVADDRTGGAGRSAARGTGDTGRADGRVEGAKALAGGSAVGVTAAPAAGVGGGAACVASASSASRRDVTGALLSVRTGVVTGEREPRTRTSVMTSAALVPRTPIDSQSHQRHLAAKNAGRRTAAGAPTARAFSLSARLSAS